MPDPTAKRYSITREGVTDLDTWLAEPEEPAMKALTQARRAAVSTQDALLFGYQRFHIEADLRWLDHTESRLSTLVEEVRDVPSSGRT